MVVYKVTVITKDDRKHTLMLKYKIPHLNGTSVTDV